MSRPFHALMRARAATWRPTMWLTGLVAISCWGSDARAQLTCKNTVPAGNVVQTTWTAEGSPYCVTGDIRVFGLTLEPGTQVAVDGAFEIDVVTTITSAGTAESPVVFTARDVAVPWKGIRFVDTEPGSSFAYTIIEHSNDHGLDLKNSLPTIRHCTIRNNSATSTGGGIQVDNATGTLLIEDSDISDNVAGTSSGYGGGLYIKGNSVIRRSAIRNNRATGNRSSGTAQAFGGGMYYASGVASLQTTDIIGNQALAGTTGGTEEGYGGGIYLAAGQLHAANVTVGCNRSSGGGGFDHRTGSGGVYVSSGTAVLENCTVARNTSRFNNGGVQRGGGTVTVHNSIVYFNDANGTQITGTVGVSYSDVQSGTPVAGVGNIAVSPAFAGLACEPGDLDIIASPAIDAGDPAPVFDDACLPPGQETSRNDMGASGGPANCAMCGDGNVDAGEACDDGDLDDGDGCDARCRIEGVATTTTTTTSTSTTSTSTTSTSSTSTSSTSSTLVGGSSTTTTSTTTSTTSTSAGPATTTSTSTTVTVTTTTTTLVNLCGNGVVDAGEQCDPAAHGGRDCCQNNCRAIPVIFQAPCGDPQSLGPCDDGDACDRDGICQRNYRGQDYQCRFPREEGVCDRGDVCSGTDAQCPTSGLTEACIVGRPQVTGRRSQSIAAGCTVPRPTAGEPPVKCELQGFAVEAARAGAGGPGAICNARRALTLLKAIRIKRLPGRTGTVSRTANLKLNGYGNKLLKRAGSLPVCVRTQIKVGGSLVRQETEVVTLTR